LLAGTTLFGVAACAAALSGVALGVGAALPAFLLLLLLLLFTAGDLLDTVFALVRRAQSRAARLTQTCACICLCTQEGRHA
jgi:hypothetical protein